MKKVLTITGSIGVLLLIAYFTMHLYTTIKLDYVKGKVIENNPEISHIQKINSIGQWGEWFSEYTLVVEMEGLKYRIWTTEKGEITDKVPL